MNVLDLAQKHVKLKKVSQTGGGEWQGPCPGCGGNDRFHVWPAKNNGAGSYWCRGCEKAGDNIQFLIDFEGMKFREACAHLNLALPSSPAELGPRQPDRDHRDFAPVEHDIPLGSWMEKAEAFCSWAQGQLKENNEVIDWLAKRGISAAAAETYRLGWNPGEKGKDIFRARQSWGLPLLKKENGRPRALWIPTGLVIPAAVNGAVVRIRIRRPEGDPRYYVIPGSSSHTTHLERDRRAAVVVESELDAIAVASNNALAGAVAVGTSHGKPDAGTFARLRECLQILVSLDFDRAGISGMKWWKENFERCDYWPVPCGKDPGEAHQSGIDLEKWIKTGLPPVMTIGQDEPTPEKKEKMTPPPEKKKQTDTATMEHLSPSVRELYDLLRRNPAVVIINQPGRLTALRNGRYVGGRISELIFRDETCLKYILRHPAEEITGENFLKGLEG